MIWVTWRQQRLQILAVFGIVAVISAVLVYVRSQAAALLPDVALVSDRYNIFLQYFVLLLMALPALLGMFFGAPLFAREIEQGTHVFALTQSVSRTRWLITKAVMACGSLAAAMFVLGVVAAWAFEPMKSSMQTRLETGQFEAQGVVVGGYAILAFAVGATAGLVLRNTLAAMVVTLIMYGAVLLTLGQSVRENYAEPSYFEAPVNQVASQAEPGRSWQVDFGFVDATGKQIPLLSTTHCAAEPDVKACFDRMNFVASYSKAHLPGQFWRFQFTELGLVLVLSTIVLGAGAWASRRRLA
ncbi:ABC transporter permease subunit [Kibdelosporangium aridum]|uniref:ABC-2 family transporter protein n=1 Tax=Kibdelosporangium aridum TaxID=2030 RepID=A0A1Y5X590_KIBAR|nr:ABC transporter permease subunit [Kibdelosporangium aridum]SMC69650.1 ABC-2 family transporter protein [Kibdelosporangium aridum]